ncbi:MAG: hypothetical protein AAB677_00260 [Patescibacteria group bacterium]
MDYTTQQLEEKYQSLPEDLKEALVEIRTAETIYNIGQKNNFHIDQIGELADEVGLAMLGLTKPNDFVSHIKNRLQLDQTAAEQIAREANEQIFLPIRESLMKLHSSSEAFEAKEAHETISGGVETFPSTQIEASAATEGVLPDKDKLLDEIENPNKTETDKVFEKKLGQLFRIPREEVDLDPYSEKPE